MKKFMLFLVLAIAVAVFALNAVYEKAVEEEGRAAFSKQTRSIGYP